MTDVITVDIIRSSVVVNEVSAGEFEITSGATVNESSTGVSIDITEVELVLEGTGPQGPPGPSGSYLGWAQYNDTQYTQASPRTILANTRAQVTMNVNTPTIDYLQGSMVGHSHWQENKFTPRAIGDSYLISLRATLRPSLIQGAALIELDIGGVFGPIVTKRVDLGLNIAAFEQLAIEMPVYCLGTFLTNGGTIYITPTVDVELADVNMLVIPEYTP
jgi:hypothetical protein